MPTTILIVDESAPNRQLIREAIGDFTYEISEAASAAEALEHVKHCKTDLVIAGVRTAEMSGVELLKRLHRNHPGVAVILVNALPAVADAVEAMELGAQDYLAKPLDTSELRSIILRALDSGSGASARASRPQFENILGHSRELLVVLEQATRAARTNSTVLIQGETGTGKELLARGIHSLSARSAKPFTTINCGAIPKDLLESELFGHVKGAFTGALMDRKGQVEYANGGTLFLDEIGEMPLELQVKLLRLLQNGEIQKLGTGSGTKVDVRVLAATHRDLAAMVRAGAFREDLFYRLNVIPLKLPSLRDRREDIPELFRFFFERSCSRHGREDLSLHGDVVDHFLAYRWPGNIRELENVVERIVVLAGDCEVRIADLPDFLQPDPNPVEAINLDLPPKGICFAGLEKEVILRALQHCNWNQSMAARYLGMSRKTLAYRVNKFHLLQYGPVRVARRRSNVVEMNTKLRMRNALRPRSS